MQVQFCTANTNANGKPQKLWLHLIMTLLLASFLVSCGGGGGGGSPAEIQVPAPYIFSTISSFEKGKAPLGLLPTGSNSLVSVSVLNDADGSVISNAIATANGQTLQYSATNKDYWAFLTIDPSQPIEVRVALSGKTYIASTNQFATYPSLDAPVSGDWWYSGEPNQLSWKGAASNSETYALGIMSSAGDILWPQDGRFQIASAEALQQTIGTGALRSGDYYALVGQRKIVDFKGATTQSGMAVRAFSSASISIFDSPISLQSINITTNDQNVAINESIQVTATGTYTNGKTKDITSTVVWSSWDPGVATVSATGKVTGTNIGQTTIQASGNGNVYTNAPVNVFRNASSFSISPASPLSQAVAYQIDYEHSGSASFKAPLNFPTAATWSTSLNGNTSYPLIAEGKVFVITGASTVTSDRGASMYALSVQTGSVLWGPVDIPGTSPFKWGSHAYDNGTIYVLGSDGVLRTFDATTGKPGWFVYATSNSWTSISSPVAKNGVVYVANEAGVGAYDQKNGNLLWLSRSIGNAGFTPAITEDGVVASAGCDLGKFDLRTGALLWRHNGPCSGSSSSAIAYSNKKVFVAGLGEHGIFDATTGTKIKDLPIITLPALANATAYTIQLGTLSAIDVASQIGQWSFSGDGKLISAPLVISGTVLIASETGNVYALDASTGVQVWNGNAGQPIRAPYFFDIYPTSGLGAGEGYLVVPAGNRLTAWRLSAP